MKLQILPGHEYDVASTLELDEHFHQVNHRLDEMVREAVKGVKPIRFSSGRVDLAAPGAYRLISRQGPEQGYVWAVMRITAQDTAAVASRYVARVHDITDLPLVPGATTYDYMDNILTVGGISGGGGAASTITYSKGQFTLLGGEYPAVFGWATAATSVTFNGEAVEVPAEMIGKLLL